MEFRVPLADWPPVVERRGPPQREYGLVEAAEGTLKANHGRISFTSAASEVHIDYFAAIDVGLPESWSHSYKKKLIREFLTAALRTDLGSRIAGGVRPRRRAVTTAHRQAGRREGRALTSRRP